MTATSPDVVRVSRPDAVVGHGQRPSSAGRIVCLGDVMVDVLAQLPGPLAVGSDTPAPVTLLGGGSAANTAAWLSFAGAAASLVGRVGADALAELATSTLHRLDLRLSTDPELPTGTCVVLVDTDGERTMVPSSGANSALSPEDVPDDLFVPGAHLHLSAYTLFSSGARSAALHALATARAAGCTVSVDAASSAPLTRFGASAFLAAVGGALVFANLDEAFVLAGTRDPSAAATALARNCGEAVVKCGARGAVWSDGSATVHVPAADVAVLDTTGAGDAFAAGALAARRSGGEPTDWLIAGNELAAEALVRAGGRPPLHTRSVAAKEPGADVAPSIRCAAVLRVEEDQCEVWVDEQVVTARYAPQFPSPHIERVSPGHLVALATATDGGEVVVWRWYDAVVLGWDESGPVRLWERAHGEVSATPRPGCVPQRPGSRAYLSAGLPGADWWVTGCVARDPRDAVVDLDAVANLYTENGLWPAALAG